MDLDQPLPNLTHTFESKSVEARELLQACQIFGLPKTLFVIDIYGSLGSVVYNALALLWSTARSWVRLSLTTLTDYRITKTKTKTNIALVPA
jgi:hypothetical protein